MRCRYGWFCGLSLSGCFFACFAWVAKALYFVAHARALALRTADGMSLTVASVEIYIQYDRFLSIYNVFYSLEFICLCASKVMVRHARQRSPAVCISH